MPSRIEIYRTKVEDCRRQAMLAKDTEERKRLLQLADQWARMADEEAKQRPPRSRSTPGKLRKPR